MRGADLRAPLSTRGVDSTQRHNADVGAGERARRPAHRRTHGRRQRPQPRAATAPEEGQGDRRHNGDGVERHDYDDDRGQQSLQPHRASRCLCHGAREGAS